MKNKASSTASTTASATSTTNSEGAITMRAIASTTAFTTSTSTTTATEGGSTMMNSTATASAPMKRSPKAVKAVLKMVANGATIDEVMAFTGRTRYTIKSWIDAYYKYAAYANKAWEQLKQNSLKEEVAPAQTPKFYDFVIEPQMIMRKEGRELIPAILRICEVKGYAVTAYSDWDISELAANVRGKFHEGIVDAAWALMEDPRIDAFLPGRQDLATEAAEVGACVITMLSSVMEKCKENGVSSIFADEFIAHNGELIVEESEQDDSEFGTKFTVPVKLNNHRRSIAAIADITEAVTQKYGINPEIRIFNSEGAQKTSPTGYILLRVGDTISVSGRDGKYAVEAEITFIADAEKDNAYESHYIKKEIMESAFKANAG